MTFDDFWQLYPRKTNKAQARKAWAKLKPSEVITADIAFNITERLAAGEWQDKQFIPHASTYLNNERWEDEVIRKDSRPSLYHDLSDTSWANESGSNLLN